MSSMVWVVTVVTQEKCQNPCGSAGRSVGTWAPGGQAGPQGLGVNAKDCRTWQLCWGNTVIKWAESHAILCGWLRIKKEPELPPHQSTSNQMDSDWGSSKKDECPKPSGIHKHNTSTYSLVLLFHGPFWPRHQQTNSQRRYVAVAGRCALPVSGLRRTAALFWRRHVGWEPQNARHPDWEAYHLHTEILWDHLGVEIGYT